MLKKRVIDVLIVVFLFASTAAIITWQNSRVGVLWDLSYILENSYRMSLGDVPYRDFPFPYAPLTFLTQALIIKITGAVFWHHIVYCCVIGAFGTVLTWQISLNLLRDNVSASRFVAFLLVLPATILGIYCIFPHPFYDLDCAFVILISVLFWQRIERKNFPLVQSFLCGVLFVVPLFIKQNIGLAFIIAVFASLIVLLIIEAIQKRSIRGYLLMSSGALIGFATALLIIQFTAGLENYVHWTIRFAAERRTPPLDEMIAIYQDWFLLLWLALFAIGFLILRFYRPQNFFINAISVILMSSPFLWSAIYLIIDADDSERAERLFGVFPFVIIVSLVFGLLEIRRRKGIALVLPFVLVAAIHGAFLSQQLWGSTYALWSLLIILVCSIFQSVFGFSQTQSKTVQIVFALLVTTPLLISGAFYVVSNERLDYINFDDGDLTQSKLPQLAGLTIRGSYLADFDELAAYADREIPRDDAILMLPGEDLFYYATGRKPKFPVLMFDHTVNPLSAEEIVAEAEKRNVKWLILKNDLQLNEEPLEDKEHIIELLRQNFKHAESLNNYEIYKRRTADDKNDDEDDDDDDSNKDDDDG